MCKAATTLLTGLIEHDASVLGITRALAVFVTLYWMYSGYAWLTNRVPTSTLGGAY